MCDAIELAKYIVSKCIDDDKPISNLQLQKILFYIQKDFIKRGKLAFPDDIEAWQFGPVVPDVYYHYCGHGATPIFYKYEETNVELNDKNRIDSIIEDKRELNPWEMVQETHKSGGAWDIIYKDGQGNRNIIPTDLISSVG